MKSTITWLIIVIIIVVGGWLLLTPSDTPTEEGPIKIGFVGPLTGEAASMGDSGIAGAELAMKEINESGGVLGRNIEIVFEDDTCSPDGGVNAMNKLVNIDKVVAVSGPDCSAAGGASLPIAQEASVPTVIRWASAPHLAKIGDYIFRIYPSDSFQGGFIANFIFEKMKKEKVGIIYVKNDWGTGLQEKFVEEFVKLGGEVVYNEAILQDSRDMRSNLSKLKDSDAEVLFLPIYPANAVAGLKQAKEMNLGIPIIGGDALDTDEVIKSPGANGLIYSLATIGLPEEFKNRVLEETGKKGDKITAPMAYDSIKIIAEAIEKTGTTDSNKVRDSVSKTSHKGVSSELIEFDENGDLSSVSYEIRVVENNESLILEDY